ncbi:hypothetical protein V8E53_013610 [Lactarius tabidus]
MSTILARARSDLRVLLKNRSPKVTDENDKLPEDVLVEIFNAYRQLHELQPDYETLWNGEEGWMKLAHVCLRWRRVVLSSSSHLRMHLLFTPRRPSKAPMLKSLPRLPILVDYSAAAWTEKEENQALAALRHRGGVRGITLRGPCPTSLHKALRRPFPELESFQICPTYDSDHHHELVLPAMLLSGSAPRLRRLILQQVTPASLSPLLSFTTGLVELAITIKGSDTSPPIPSLVRNLQRMSRLRRLELNLLYRPEALYLTFDHPPLSASAGAGVALPKLTHLTYTAHRSYLQELVGGMATPSLQHLDGKLLSRAHNDFLIPHLCKFIKDTASPFNAVRLEFSHWDVEFYGSHSSSDKHFRITIPEDAPLEQLGPELSGQLYSVEELVVTSDTIRWFTEQRSRRDFWRRFFCHAPQVKSLQLPGEMALDIAESFEQDDQQTLLDLLPALERIEVRSLVGEGDHYATIRGAFKPLVAARKKAGRTLKFSWSLWSYKDHERWLVR